MSREKMQAAAKILREVAAGTSPVPWKASGNHLDGPKGAVAIAYQCFADARWMMLMDPGLAGPLANWLEDAADTWRQQVRESDGKHEECGGRVNDNSPDRCWCFEYPCATAQRILDRAGRTELASPQG